MGVRGFVLSGEDDFLEPLMAGESSFDKFLESLSGYCSMRVSLLSGLERKFKIPRGLDDL